MPPLSAATSGSASGTAPATGTATKGLPTISRSSTAWAAFEADGEPVVDAAGIGADDCFALRQSHAMNGLGG